MQLEVLDELAEVWLGSVLEGVADEEPLRGLASGRQRRLPVNGGGNRITRPDIRMAIYKAIMQGRMTLSLLNILRPSFLERELGRLFSDV